MNEKYLAVLARILLGKLGSRNERRETFLIVIRAKSDTKVYEVIR